MADIKKELNDIKNAVYGKEVRGSIHDGIKKINDEVENATDLSESAKHQVENIQQQVNQLVVEGDSSVEAAQARVTADGKVYDTLRDRLNSTDEQLAQTTSNILNVDRGWNVVGDGVTDDTQAIQNAINHAINNGFDVFIPNGKYYITNDIKIENAKDINIMIQPEAIFITEGNHEGIDIYPQSNKIPRQRAFFAIIDSENVTFSGGKYDCSGFGHPGDGRAASAILVLRSENVVVEKTKLYDLKPTGVWGSYSDNVDGVTVEIRYTGILGIKTKSLTIKDNYAHTMAYSAYECRIGCQDTKFIGNYAENCAEHLIQPTIRYGQAPLEELDVEDRTNHGVVIAYNTGKGATTDITTHAENIVIYGNTLIDVYSQRAMSFRMYTKGCEVFGNTIICVTQKGDSAFQFQPGVEGVSVHSNVVTNFKNAFDGSFVEGYIGHNTYIDVDDIDRHRSVNGIRSGLHARGDYLSAFGGESAYGANGIYVTAMGWRSALNSTGDRVTTVGANSGSGNTQNNLTSVGYMSALNNSGQFVTSIGYESAQDNTGDRVVAIGSRAGKGNTKNDVILIGHDVGINNDIGDVVALGADPTEPRQVQLGAKHIEMKNVISQPSTPPAGSGRLFFREHEGKQKLSVIFANGRVRDIVTDT